MTREEKIDTVYRLFRWLNRINETGEEMQRSEIEAIFTPYAPMMLNGRVICHDHATHFQHALDLKSQMAKWHFNIPFKKVVVEANQVVGYYTVDFEDKDGNKNCMYDYCFFTVEGGKISSIFETVYFEGKDLEIESFD